MQNQCENIIKTQTLWSQIIFSVLILMWTYEILKKNKIIKFIRSLWKCRVFLYEAFWNMAPKSRTQEIFLLIWIFSISCFVYACVSLFITSKRWNMNIKNENIHQLNLNWVHPVLLTGCCEWHIHTIQNTNVHTFKNIILSA